MPENKPIDEKTKLQSETYKPISEREMEEEAASRSKTDKSKFKEPDGADERMLSNEDSKVSVNSEIPMKDIKIVMTEKNGDAKVEEEDEKKFGGLSKEELMKFANDPFWVRLRWFLFITFWVLWAAMLFGAIMIIYAAPKCDPPPPRTWWQVGPLAEVKDSISSEKMKSLTNIKGLIISFNDDPYQSVNDSHAVIQLIKDAQEAGKKVIIDLDPSTTNMWFEESQNNNSLYADYYIWKKPKYTGDVREPPNNWKYLNNTSSWVYSPKRNQYYYAPLSAPHLNFRNPAVAEEFAGVVKKFAKLGASGVRVRNAPLLLVDPNFEEETLITNKVGINIGEPGFFVPSKTRDLPDVGSLLFNWNKVVKNVTEGGPLMIDEEISKINSYTVFKNVVVDLPLLVNVFSKPNVTAIVQKLNETFKVDNIKWPLWKENNSSLPSDVVEIVTNLLPGATLVDVNTTTDAAISKIRDSPSIMRGNCDMYSINNDTVFGFIREIAGNPGVLVLLNTANKLATVNINQDIPPLSKLEEVTIQYYSQNYNVTEYKDIGAKKGVTDIPLAPKSVLVLQYVPKKE
ncbi:unnamed protein product [Phyllotreta striolata]|uniref:alpha-glucosidase n=1 Tax=Phyllotreta striolata TaxID=444603 RepID=A0A9N9TUC0_PHYSR|nr:unnamed protein product [Phyllotreta striolata]